MYVYALEERGIEEESPLPKNESLDDDTKREENIAVA